MKIKKLKVKHLPIFVRTMRKNINYQLYNNRINNRINILEESIKQENKQLKINKEIIAQLYDKYDQYDVELITMKRQIIAASEHYSSIKIDKKIKSLKEQINDNNEYFGKICEINKKIGFIKLKLNSLITIIQNKENINSDIINKINFYQKRLEVYEFYLRYLEDRKDYKKKYVKKK